MKIELSSLDKFWTLWYVVDKYTNIEAMHSLMHLMVDWVCVEIMNC